MRKRNKYILKFLIIASILLVPVFATNQFVRADTDVTSFNSWRPWLDSCGCHSGATNTISLGSVEFDSPLSVRSGEQFSMRLKVTGFMEAADGAITVGLNIDDYHSLLLFTKFLLSKFCFNFVFLDLNCTIN